MQRFRFLILLLFTIFFAVRAYSTAQESEYIFIDGKMYGLCTCPLEYNKKLKAKFVKWYPLEWESTALWRGYIGYWSIKGNKLYLDSLQCNIKDIGRKTIIPKDEKIFASYLTNNGVCASWFSEELRIVDGQEVKRVHDGFMTIFEHETFLTIKKGGLTDKRIENNSLICANSIGTMEAYTAFREAFKQEFPDEATNRINCTVYYSEFDANGNPTKVDAKIEKMREDTDRKEDIKNFISTYLLEHRILGAYNLNGKYKTERCTVVLGK